MRKRTGAIIFFTIGVLFGVYCLVVSICHHARPISIVLDSILLAIFGAELYLTCKGNRDQDNHNADQ